MATTQLLFILLFIPIIDLPISSVKCHMPTKYQIQSTLVTIPFTLPLLKLHSESAVFNFLFLILKWYCPQSSWKCVETVYSTISSNRPTCHSFFSCDNFQTIQNHHNCSIIFHFRVSGFKDLVKKAKLELKQDLFRLSSDQILLSFLSLYWIDFRIGSASSQGFR